MLNKRKVALGITVLSGLLFAQNVLAAGTPAMTIWLPSPSGKLLAPPPSADTLEGALTGGKVSLDVRYRYESVEDESTPARDADASTLRTRLGYSTGNYQGLSALIEMENTTVVGKEKYNSTVNGLTQYAVVADPDGTEVNQALISYAGFSDTLAKFGRQRITLDNHRWVGNVGWRQNEQTYDGLSVVNTSLPDTRITYAYISGVNRVFGNSSAVGRFTSDSNLINVAYNGLSFGTLVGYNYLLDFENALASSSNTYGARFAGKHGVGGGIDALYTLELARQSDYGDNPARFDLDYSLIEIGGFVNGITATLGYETLGSNGVVALQTPLATLHAANGWADKFLVTPVNGLQDTYFSVAGTVAKIKLMGVYHDFSADAGGADYGEELDLHAWYPFGKYTVGVKYASYSAKTFSFDTDKLWVYGEFKF